MSFSFISNVYNNQLWTRLRAGTCEHPAATTMPDTDGEVQNANRDTNDRSGVILVFQVVVYSGGSKGRRCQGGCPLEGRRTTQMRRLQNVGK